MDGRAWWVAVYGVTQSWTRLKRLSSSSSSIPLGVCVCVCVCVCENVFFTHLYITGHLGHLHSLAIVNNVTMSRAECIFLFKFIIFVFFS